MTAKLALLMLRSIRRQLEEAYDGLSDAGMVGAASAVSDAMEDVDTAIRLGEARR